MIKKVFRVNRGFTLIEIAIVIAIIAIVGAGLTTAIMAAVSGSSYSNNFNKVVNSVRNAGEWISKDVQMSELTPNTSPNDPPGSFLVLVWVDYDAPNVIRRVAYSVTNGNLIRSYYTKNPAMPSGSYILEDSRIISQYIKIDSCNFTNGALTIQITANTGGYKPQIETKVFKILPRPHSV